MQLEIHFIRTRNKNGRRYQNSSRKRQLQRIKKISKPNTLLKNFIELFHKKVALPLSIREKIKSISFDSRDWYKYRRFRITSSNAAKFLYNYSDKFSSLDPDPYPIGICGNFAVEKAIQLFFAKKMFSTGIWVDKKYKWLATTPDALIEIETQLFPVQIKAITVKKDIMDVAKEYYTQIQLHIQVTNASKLLLIVYFKQTCLLNSVFVKRDDQFLSILLKRLEFAYLNHIPFMLFRQPTKEDIKSMIEDDRFRNTFLKLSRNDDLFESESKKPNVKHISLEAFSFSKQEVNFLSRLTFTSYLLKTTEISKRIFWEKWSSYIADDKDEWFPKKIEAVTKILRNLQSQLRQ